MSRFFPLLILWAFMALIVAGLLMVAWPLGIVAAIIFIIMNVVGIQNARGY